MSVVETMIDIFAEHEKSVCGQPDEYLKKIGRTPYVTMISRDEALKIIGSEDTTQRAKSVFNNLIKFSRRGNVITQQNVDYALSLPSSEKDHQTLEIDKDITCRTINGKPVKPKTMGQRHYVDSIRKKMIVFGTGPAGTGKIYLVMAIAVQTFKDGEVNRIIPTRPVVEAGEKLGFLPGDLRSKIDSYLRPPYDTLCQIMGAENYLCNLEKGLIEAAPLAYIRGRTLDNAYIILDEAQNTTPVQIEMSLTHIGFGSKIIVTGDQTWKDLSGGATSDLDTAVKVLKWVDDIGFCYLTSSDVVCRPLVQKTVQAYDDYEMKAKRNADKGGRSRGNSRDR